ncbi:hypothetical protein PRK78_007322 [Emydomyces testavorans]|uniref:non-specific serine/threonine protein kinase n=1 Tax=Emydomyces testavorans TaxID=2070801 RepID=A0AAF0IMK4_9EURO|nr:hypothetical protein PRK78_007322 [Emydomyces testavorans]
MSSRRLIQPRVFPTSGFEVAEATSIVEEEMLPGYIPDKFYPVRLGEILNDRYQVVGKLGYGTTSTVWLGRDLQEDGYAALKVYLSGLDRDNELKVYNCLNMIDSDHPGKAFIRKLLGSFQLKGPHGNHLCLVHEPLGLNLDQVLDFYPKRKLPLEILKSSLRQILVAVNFLNVQAGIIHTEAEFSQPAPRKILEDRIIYGTRRVAPSNGLPFLCDLGEARFSSEVGIPGEDIMPNVYKAPEVILKMKWDHKVDIWSIGMVDDRVHVAEMTALLGSPPAEFLKRSEMCRAVWNEDGSWKGVVPLPDITLEGLGSEIAGKDTKGFLRWLRRILCWLPEDRATTEELLFDPWLMEGLGQEL